LGRDPRSDLVAGLRRAAAEMSGDAGRVLLIGRFDTKGEFALHLTRAAEAINGGDLTSLSELALTFAPTGDWDDAGGSVATGNDVYRLIRQCRATGTGSG
jgi:hypothetical protein